MAGFEVTLHGRFGVTPEARRRGIRLKLVTLKRSSLGYDLRTGKRLNVWKLITFVLLRMATQRVWSGVGLVAARYVTTTFPALTLPALPEPVRYVASTFEPGEGSAP